MRYRIADKSTCEPIASVYTDYDDMLEIAYSANKMFDLVARSAQAAGATAVQHSPNIRVEFLEAVSEDIGPVWVN